MSRMYIIANVTNTSHRDPCHAKNMVKLTQHILINALDNTLKLLLLNTSLISGIYNIALWNSVDQISVEHITVSSIFSGLLEYLLLCESHPAINTPIILNIY